ncbi:sugar-binding transcriptional regulator [Tropicibacter naphthalenivorans]|uniref:Transcriptional regulator LsrR n=1 Tax=Tropicibacter naphthalenivorans TaxID=441103 RepID=A0A0N7M086_9RHOB|nr:sugar-binding transcriptional regulator [Tropicibacter naphthalenivorans]CUH79769.1 Transcriptional regulator LsrR [Tropicibacter naphthalenivorans]SMC75054.1 DNA-binding transcriptional regulator LsrR, DeoR family [Tropicibacter naphthalenivorans]
MSKADAEHSLAIRAAWLHYVGGLTQAKVAKKLGVPSVKAHRLIAKAVAEGAVKVTIDGDIVECIALEEAICERYGLDSCDVAPDLGEEGLPIRTLALAGSARLRRWLESGEETTIGIGHGRTLAAAVRQLPHLNTSGLRFVSLLGGLTRNFSANPHDVMHLIAEKTGAQAYVMPVPFFANTTEDRAVLLSQNGVREVFEMAETAPLKIVGIGTVEADTQLVTSGMIEPAEIEAIRSAGAAGEMLGHFFDADGRSLETPLTSRTLAVSFGDWSDHRIVALAGGVEKVKPIQSVLRSGLLSGLITDEVTARALLEA